MAYYAALMSVVQSLQEISNRDQYPKFLIDKQQIASVYEKLSHLQALLEDYSPEDEEAADCLEKRIRDAAYQVQYILESQDIFESKLSCRVPQRDKTHGIENVHRRLSIAKSKRAMPRQSQEIEKVKEEVDSIVEEVTRMKIKKSHIAEELELTNYHSALEQKQTSSEDNMVGFEEQQTTIMDQLCEGSSKLLEAIPLVGMGGIGKTKLARSIFDHKLLVHHFDRRAWITISQKYNRRKLLLAILDSMKVDTKNLSEAKEPFLKEHIYKHLKWRRYLIILDDIWDTKDWDYMKMILPDDNNGSRIILTTRLSDVAVYAKGCGSLHQMQLLDKDQSWNLLREKVFGQENCPQELEVIGRLIANNCRGLPLAIVVVAGLLSMVNKARNDWEDIARIVRSLATENNEHLSKILSLSYNQLPHHLKPCFLHMGGFPEDYKFHVPKLINLWAAEGFLEPNEFKSLEEIGEEYLENLVKRNLVLVTHKNSNGKFKYCSIHDVLRDLCVKRARYESFFHVVDDNYGYSRTGGIRNIIRCLYIHPKCSLVMKAKEFGSRVGSILCFHDIRGLMSFTSSFKRLRILDTQDVSFFSFPVEVLELSRLRYLALSRRNPSQFRIPWQISKFENLHTLIIGPTDLPCIQDNPVPFGLIWKMPNLRHVIVGYMQLSSPIPFACILENLRTLSRVKDFRFTKRAIQMIPNLKKLKVVYGSERKKLWEEFCLYNLVLLCQLEALNISFYTRRVENFPDNFAFPQKLIKLTLSGCRLPWKNMTAVGSLHHLQVLKLQVNAFVGDEWEPMEGEFPQLKFLEMSLLELKYWRAEKTHFPRLAQLHIRRCGKLEEIPLEIGDIPTLELIEVYDSKLAADSALRIQEEQQDMGNDVLQVYVYDNWTLV